MVDPQGQADVARRVTECHSTRETRNRSTCVPMTWLDVVDGGWRRRERRGRREEEGKEEEEMGEEASPYLLVHACDLAAHGVPLPVFRPEHHVLAVVALYLLIGPGTCRSPHHRMSSNLSNGGSNCVARGENHAPGSSTNHPPCMTWRAGSARHWVHWCTIGKQSGNGDWYTKQTVRHSVLHNEVQLPHLLVCRHHLHLQLVDVVELRDVAAQVEFESNL